MFSRLLNLPNEILLEIAEELPAKHLTNLLVTCNQLRVLYTPLLYGKVLRQVMKQDRNALFHEESNEPRQGPLQHAARTGNLDAARALLDYGSLDINTLDAHPWGSEAPLHAAAEADQRQMIEFLLSRNADLEVLDQRGRTPLCAGSMHCSQLETLELLIKKGANIHVQTSDEKRRTIPIAVAEGWCPGWDKRIEFLVQHGADLTIPTAEGNLLLHYAYTSIIEHFEIGEFEAGQSALQTIIKLCPGQLDVHSPMLRKTPRQSLLETMNPALCKTLLQLGIMSWGQDVEFSL